MTGWWKNEIHSGEPVAIRDKSIVPFFQSITMDIPGTPVHFTWKRPVSILLIDSAGGEVVAPVQDVTRQAVLGILGASLLFWLIFRLKSFRGRF
jgi:hypothetical protein